MKRSLEKEAAQIRRPFSVAEVETLVLAVEKIGTGRRRDVKLHAFDNAKHRTCVDLMILRPRTLSYRQYRTTRAGWPSRVVSVYGYMDHGAETMLSSMSLVSKAALLVSVLIPVRCLWLLLPLRLRHRDK